MAFMTRYKIPILLFLLGVVMFSTTMDAQLLLSWDDNRYLEDNTLVQQFQIGKILTQAYWGSYIPVTLLTYAVEYKMWGLHPTGYHVVNTLLHAINGVLVFFFLFLLTRQRAAAVIGAVLFIVHPVQVESVAWIAQRKNLLCMFFFLWAFICHIRSRQENNTGRLWMAWFLYLLSVLSKPAVVGAPILFMAYDYFWARLSVRRTITSAIVPAAIAVFGAVAIIVTSSEVGGIKELWGGSRWSALQLTFLTTWENLTGLLDIYARSPHYLYFEDVIEHNWRVWAGLLVLLLFAGLSLYSLVRFIRDREYKPLTFFLFLWVGAFMLPVSNIIPIAIQRSDRHIYFPSVLLFLMVGTLWSWLWRRQRDESRRHLLVGAMVALTVFFMGGTYRYARIWNNSASLWTYHLKKFPYDDVAVNNLAIYYYRSNQYPEALQTYAKLARMTPENFRPYLFPGLIAYNEERYDEAIRFIRRSMPLADENLRKSILSQLLEAYSRAAKKADREGRYKDETVYYHGVIELLPDNPSVFKDLADAYRKMGDFAAARAAYQRAIALSPGYFGAAQAGLGQVLLAQGQADAARSIFEEVLGTDPTALAAGGLCQIAMGADPSPETLKPCYLAAALAPESETFSDQLTEALLAVHEPDQALSLVGGQLAGYPDLLAVVSGKICARAGNAQKALGYFGQSDRPAAQLNLGETALVTGDYPLADTAFKRVLASEKENPKAVAGRCLALVQSGDFQAALPLCETAVRQQPGNARCLTAYGDLLVAEQRIIESVDVYEKALTAGAADIKPKLAAVLYTMGRQAESNGWTVDAIQFYNRAVDLQPMNTAPHQNLGRLCLSQGRFTEALTVYNRLTGLAPDSAAAFAGKGIAAHALGEETAAAAAFEQALALDPESANALSGYCHFLKDTGGTTEPICSMALKSQS